MDQLGAAMRMPLTVWSWFITAILGLLAFGVLLSAGILLLMDRNLGTSFYVPLVVVNGVVMRSNFSNAISQDIGWLMNPG